MDTPILDFVRSYAQSGRMRLHMPGHKGSGPLGFEHLDLTEVASADSLYEPDGIIAASEQNASLLFGCPTFYSTEGSSQCIRAMVHLAALDARAKGQNPVIAAGRNAHKAFLSAAALTDTQVVWLYPKGTDSYLSCGITASDVAALENVTAVYLTSPDYLGNMADIAAISKVCRQKGMLLLVDNAHGAYLRFLEPSLHPMDLGADLCCDSAHKTLPVLTGGAYLHIRDAAWAPIAKRALALYGSTSPSYLILQSLDAANGYLADGYVQQLAQFVGQLELTKQRLRNHGYRLCGSEPMKLTLAAKEFGFTGTQLAALLREKNAESEFADPDYLVLMPAPGTDLVALENILISISRQRAITAEPPAFFLPEKALSIRDAIFSPARQVAVADSIGCILADASVGCPPAVPIVVCGERIDQAAVDAFRYYGVETVWICK